MDTICVIGLGYVGLPTAIVAAQHGYTVIGFDIDKNRVDLINRGTPPIHEPELKERLTSVFSLGKFYATDQLPQADCFIIAVPTPLSRHDDADLKYVFSATDTITTQIKTGDLVVLESTVPVGTTELVAKMLSQKTGLIVGKDIFVAHCPERVWPSKVFHEIIHNDRVIGGITTACTTRAAKIYQSFVKGAITHKSARFAELIKLVENSSIDVSVALAHQVAVLAEENGIDPYELIETANKHPRVKIWTPTCGVGGHCVAVDPWFLIQAYPHKTRLLQAARLTNDERPTQVITNVTKTVHDWNTTNANKTCTILLLGVTYKANVDDLRESPALKIVHTLINKFCNNTTEYLVCDPLVNQEKLASLFDNKYITSLDEGLKKADIIVSLVAHDNFKTTKTCGKIILDFSGLQLHRRQQLDMPYNFIAHSPKIDQQLAD